MIPRHVQRGVRWYPAARRRVTRRAVPVCRIATDSEASLMYRLCRRWAARRPAALLRWTLPPAAAALLLAATVASAQSPAATKSPYERHPAAIEEGRQLYSRRCIFCHGTGGAGAKGSDLTGDRSRLGRSDDALFDVIANGRPGTQMGAFATSMTPEEIWKVIAYLRSQGRGNPE